MWLSVQQLEGSKEVPPDVWQMLLPEHSKTEELQLQAWPHRVRTWSAASRNKAFPPPRISSTEVVEAEGERPQLVWPVRLSLALAMAVVPPPAALRKVVVEVAAEVVEG